MSRKHPNDGARHCAKCRDGETTVFQPMHSYGDARQRARETGGAKEPLAEARQQREYRAVVQCETCHAYWAFNEGTPVSLPRTDPFDTAPDPRELLGRVVDADFAKLQMTILKAET